VPARFRRAGSSRARLISRISSCHARRDDARDPSLTIERDETEERLDETWAGTESAQSRWQATAAFRRRGFSKARTIATRARWNCGRSGDARPRTIVSRSARTSRGLRSLASPIDAKARLLREIAEQEVFQHETRGDHSPRCWCTKAMTRSAWRRAAIGSSTSRHHVSSAPGSGSWKPARILIQSSTCRNRSARGTAVHSPG